MFVAYPTHGRSRRGQGLRHRHPRRPGQHRRARPLGGFILALVEELGAGYISSGYRDAMGFLLIIVILLFKPTGLFARKERIG